MKSTVSAPRSSRVVFHALCLLALIVQTLTPALTFAAEASTPFFSRLTVLAAQHLPAVETTALIAGLPAFINVVIEPETLPADGETPAQVLVYVNDAEGLPVPDGTPVILTSTLGSLEPAALVTRDGLAQTTLLAPDHAGSGDVVAQCGTVQATASFQAQPGQRVGQTAEGLPPAAMSEAIQRARNPLHPQTQEQWNAVNRRYAAAVSAQGVQMTVSAPDAGSQAAVAADWNLSLQLDSVRVGGQEIYRAKGLIPQVQNNAAFFQHTPALSEQQLALDAGMQQLFTLAAPLDGEGDLILAVNLSTPMRAELLSAQQGVLFFTPNANPNKDERYALLAYSGALARDAEGRERYADLALDGNMLLLRLPADWLAQAVYPIVIDPLIGSPALVSDPRPQQADIALAYNPNAGEYLAVWESYTTGGSGADLRAQRFQADGALLGAPISVTTASGEQLQPAVAFNATANEYLVVWSDYRQDSSGDIYAQRISANGTVTGSNFIVAAATGLQDDPDVAANPNNNLYLAVWRDRPGSAIYVSGQVIAASGALSGTEIILYNGSGDNQQPRIAYNSANGEFLAVWSLWWQSIYGKRLSGVGVPLDNSGTPANEALSSVAFTINAASGNQYSPALTADTLTGNYLVAWQDYRSESYGDLYGQLVTGAGALSGSEIALSVVTGSIQASAALVYDTVHQKYLAMWSDTRLNNEDLYAQAISAGGVLSGSAFSVYSGTLSQLYPSVVSRPDNGESLVIWNDWGNVSRNLYGRRVVVNGVLPAAAFPLQTTGATKQYPAVAYNSGAGTYLTLWEDLRNGLNAIYAQAYTSQGTPLGDNFALTTVPVSALQQHPRVAAGENGYLAVWEDQVQDTDGDIYAQRFTAQGVVTGSAFALSATAERQTAPAVAYNAATDTYLAVWRDMRVDSDGDIYGQILNADGVISGSAIIVSAYPGYSQSAPDVSYNPVSGEFLVVWQQYAGSGNYDVYAQRMSGNGVRLDHPGTAADESAANISLPVSTASSYQTAPQVAAEPNSGAYLVVWEDSRNGASDIYAQRLDATAALTGSNFVVAAATYVQRIPVAAAISGTTDFLVVWEDQRAGSGLGVLYAQRVASNGTLHGGNEALGSNRNWTLGIALAPASVTGRALVVWEWGYEIYQQFYSVVAANFNATPLHGVAPLSVAFSDASAPAGELTTHTWVFGDGGTSSEISPTHVYEQAGVYTVTLSVAGESGAHTLTRTTYITVSAVPTLGQGLQGYWPLDETSGTRHDASSNGNDLADNNTVAYATGVISRAADFERDATESLSIAHSLQQGLAITGSLTLVGWIRPESVSANMSLVSKYAYGTANDRSYRLELLSSGYLRFIVSPDGAFSESRDAVSSSATFSSGTWRHVAAVFDAAEQRLTLYCDGAACGTRTITYDTLYAGTAPFVLGATTYNDAAYYPFDGLMDDWRVYDRALSASEIHTLWQPAADFSAAPDSGAAPLTVTFSNATAGAVTSYLWDFGDGITSAITNPTHVYTEAGLYTVSLAATGPGGTDVLTRSAYIQVNALVESPARIAASESSLGVGAVVTFSAGTATGFQSLTWDLGDGTVINDEVQITHTYATSGSYSVKLHVVDAQGITKDNELPVSVGVPSQPQSFVAPPEAPENAAPWLFVENQGEFVGGARFKVENGAQTMWLAPDGIWLTIQETPVNTDTGVITVANLKLSFVGANTAPVLAPLDRTETKMSYFLGDDPEHWHADVPVWEGVRYIDLYPGLDLEITGAGGQLTWQLVQREGVEPPTSLDDVQLQIEGAAAIDLIELVTDTQSLLITTTLGSFVLPLLQAVKENGAAPDEPLPTPMIQGSGMVNGPFATRMASVREKLQQNGGMYSIILSGNSTDIAGDIASDQTGIYLTGFTYNSIDFTHTYTIGTVSQQRDIYVTKLSPNGEMIFGTIVGYTGSDQANGIAVDQEGNIYVAGQSEKCKPLSGGLAFKLSADGTEMLYPEVCFNVRQVTASLKYEIMAHSIAVDRDKNAYIVGEIYTITVDAGSGTATKNPNPDAFIAKLDPDGISVTTYTQAFGSFSGIEIEKDVDVALNPSQDAVYVVGTGFVRKISTTSSEVYTEVNETKGEVHAVAVDQDENVYIAGAGYYPGSGERDAFITELKFTPTGPLSHTVYLGGSGEDVGEDLVVDKQGAVYVTGYTKSNSNFPLIDAFDTTYNGYNEAFVAKVNMDTAQPEFSSYLGGSAQDEAVAITLAPTGVLYVTGKTTSSDFPSIIQTYGTRGGGYDVFVSAIPPAFPWSMGLSPCECPFSCVAGNCQGWQGGPINTQSGNYHYSQRDVSIPALGGSLYFERSYNSRMTDTYTTTLGNGWTHNYDVQLVFTDTVEQYPAGTVVVKGCRGSRFPFANNGNRTYTAYPGVWATLTYSNTVNRYFLRGVDQSTYVFNGTGQLIEIHDAQGFTTTLTYSNDRLSRVADATGRRYLDFGHDVQGRITSVTDNIGRTTGYGYNAVGDLVAITGTLNTPAQPVRWTYAYTGTHLLYEILNPAGGLVERTNYDNDGRAAAQWTALSDDPLTIEYGSGVVTTTDALGRQTLEVYDARNTLIARTLPGGGETQRAYDFGFNPGYIEDAAGNATQAVYNEMGRPETVVDALGHQTAVGYDDAYQPTSIQDARGVTTAYEYDGARITRIEDALDGETINTYDEITGFLVQSVDHGVTTTYAYNEFGQRTAITNAQGLATTYEYDEVGRLITTTASNGLATVNTYDAGDRVIATTRNVTVTGGRNYLGVYNLTTEYAYDLAGRQVQITDTFGMSTRKTYDAAGRLIATTANYSPTIFPAHGADNLWNNVTQYAYDDLGRQTYVTDTLNSVTYTEYDEAGRVWRVWRNYRSGKMQNWLGVYNLLTEYGYDVVGNQTRVTDTLGRVTFSQYDAVGRLVRSTENYVPGTYPAHGANNDQNLSTIYGYDAVGNQTHVTDTLGHVTYTEYDALNRPVRVTTNYSPSVNGGQYNPAYPDTNLSQVNVYDAETGRLVRTIDSAGRVTYHEYDVAGRGIAVTSNYANGVFSPAQPDVDLRQVTVYDEATGRVTQTIDPAGRVTYREYDTAGRAVTVTTNYDPSVNGGRYDPAHPDLNRKQATVYDPMTGRVASRLSIAGATIPTTYAYDAAGRLITTTDALSGTSVTEYDILGRRTATINAEGQRTTYAYDAAGRLITTTANFVDGSFSASYPDEDVQTVIHYNALGQRMAQTDALGHTTQFTYDGAGRLHEQIDPLGHITHYTYDALGRRTAVTDPDGVVTTYHYDALGRQVEVCDALNHCASYTYDAAGHQTTLTNANAIITRYAYDGQDRLIAVTENYTQSDQKDSQTNINTTYTYDVDGNLTQIHDALGHNTVYTYNQAGQRVAEANALGYVTRYVYDGHGRQVQSVYPDAGGPLTVTTAYNALGWPTQIVYPGVGEVSGFTVTYAYDALGQRQVVTDASGVMIYDYDALYRPAEIAAPTGNVSYTYDAAGRRANLIYPTGEIVTYTHDAAGRLTQVKDWEGHSVIYGYTDAGRLQSVRRPNGILSAYDYDEAGRLIGILHQNDQKDVVGSYTYSLDSLGNRVQVTEYLSQTVSPDPTPTPAAVNANFVVTTTSGAAPLMVTFGDASTGDADAWHWDFGDGASSEAQHPTHVYTQNGVYDVTLTISNTLSQDSDSRIRNDVVTVSAPVSPTDAAAMAYNPNTQGYLWVWQQETGTAQSVAIYGRWVSGDGSQSTPFVIVSGSVSRPDVAYNPDVDKYLVVWQTSTGAIQGRTVAALLGSVQTFASASGQDPQVDYQRDDPFSTSTSGHWLVVWQQRVGTEQRVMARALSSSGTLETAFTVGNGGDLTAADVIPAVVAGSAGEFLIIWPSHTNNGVGNWTPYTLHARRVEATGTLAAAFSVAGSADTAYIQPQVTYNPDDDLYLVVWAEHYEGSGSELPINVWARQIANNALRTNFESDPLQVSAAVAGSNATQPVVSYFADHGSDIGLYLIAWQQTQNGNVTIPARRFTPSTMETRGIFTLTDIASSYSSGGYSAAAISDIALARGGVITKTLIGWTTTKDDFWSVAATFYQPLRGYLDYLPLGDPGKPLPVQFWGDATPAGITDAWQWNFGDGGQANTRYPQHTFSLGQFDVTLTITDTDSGESAVQTWSNAITVTGRSITYIYDPLNRLTSADYSTGEHYAYQYDAVGNRTAMTTTSGVTTYAYDAANRLTSATLPGSGVRTYTWDNRGNLLSDGTFTYTYSAAGRMVQAESLAVTRVYTYNADGLRVAQAYVGAPGAQTYVWDWATGVPEMLNDGRYTYLVGLDTVGWHGSPSPMGQIGWTYALPDALGSVRQEADANGGVSAAREWSPYGEEIGGGQTGLGYTGEWFDAGVGLTYLRARWYDGATGRFTQIDPLFAFTPYLYANNNPVKFVDPSGFRGILPWNIYYQNYGRSLSKNDPDIINDLKNTDTVIALEAITKIELNFQGNPNYEGLPLEILLVSSLYGTCIRDPLFNSKYPDDMIGYTTQAIFPDRNYNQYDWLISGWVDYWNWRARQAGKSYQLDPNFFKAIAYIETALGYVMDPTNQSYIGIAQLGAEAEKAALLGSGVGSVQWGGINVVNINEPSHNIAGAIRWLMYKFEVDAQQAGWDKAYAYFAGYSGDTAGAKVKDVLTVYNTGLDINWREGNHYLFYRSLLQPDPREEAKKR